MVGDERRADAVPETSPNQQIQVFFVERATKPKSPPILRAG